MPAMTGEPQQDRSRATRVRLLRSAVQCLATHGYAASTVAVVARHAGVSRGAAQHHFPTRTDLFTAAVDQVMQERREQLRKQLLPTTDARDTLSTVEVLFDLFSSELFKAALVLWVAAASEPALREQVAPLEEKIGRETHRLVVELLDVDESAPGMRETVQATLDLARGLGLANLLSDDRRRRSRIAREWAANLDLIAPQRQHVQPMVSGFS
ncbi:MAG: acnR 2 [Frankiales bacterium]|nr:acnR 2 [Frankiales bacterium]